MYAAYAPKEGEVARVAIYRSQENDALASLARMGWEPAADAPEEGA
jgi:hypothetical protein